MGLRLPKWECDKCGQKFYGKKGNDAESAFCTSCGSLKTQKVVVNE
jgi:NAD-dependent SIR2 family protein deacetylase